MTFKRLLALAAVIAASPYILVVRVVFGAANEITDGFNRALSAVRSARKGTSNASGVCA